MAGGRADIRCIEHNPIIFSPPSPLSPSPPSRSPLRFAALRAASLRKRMWLGAVGVALFLGTLLSVHLLDGARRTGPRDPGFGLDFIAFYTGGSFINEGRHRDLFNLRAVRDFQRDLAARHGVDLGTALGPWWNPPFYAWVFSPLARLSFPAATWTWIGINIACCVGACWLLVRMLPAGCGWRTWGLVPVGVALSVPFIHCVTHGQNTGTSLLLVAIVVTFWRSGRGLAAGLLAGLLLFKPQLGAVLALALAASMGRRAVLGLGITGTALLLVSIFTLPGAVEDYVFKLSSVVPWTQAGQAYPWERQVTWQGFWRLLLQGPVSGPAPAPARALWLACALAIGAGLICIMVRAARADGLQRDRLIAAAVTAMPLLMPYYMDYDLLLLSVPAVLFAAEMSRRAMPMSRLDQAVLAGWGVLYVWLFLNFWIGQETRLSLTVPLLTVQCAALMARAWKCEPPTSAVGAPTAADVPAHCLPAWTA